MQREREEKRKFPEILPGEKKGLGGGAGEGVPTSQLKGRGTLGEKRNVNSGRKGKKRRGHGKKKRKKR